MKSQDRSEPPVGAKVTLQLLKKFGGEYALTPTFVYEFHLFVWSDHIACTCLCLPAAKRMGWVVSVLFDDLLDWSDWFIRKRLKPPLNLVALGA